MQIEVMTGARTGRSIAGAAAGTGRPAVNTAAPVPNARDGAGQPGPRLRRAVGLCQNRPVGPKSRGRNKKPGKRQIRPGRTVPVFARGQGF
jgi:hypothetical protein